jgi:integrase
MVRKRGKFYHINFTIDGEQTRKSARTTDRKEAEEFEQRERERFWRLKKLGDTGSELWEVVAEKYSEEVGSKREKQILDWFALRLTGYPLTAVTPKVIGQLRQLRLMDTQYRGKVARSTVNRHMSTLRSVLNMAVNCGMLASGPRVPMFKLKENEPRFLTHEEFAALYRELPEHLKPAACFAVQTGLRERAMGTLVWSRIDIDNRKGWIPSANQKAGRTFGFPLSDDAMKTLNLLKESTGGVGHLFRYKGKPIGYLGGRAFKKAAKRAGVLPLRWHDLRHTWASWSVQSGVTLGELMQLGDWRSYSMVLRYAHFCPAQLSTAANKVSTKLAQSALTSCQEPIVDGSINDLQSAT